MTPLDVTIGLLIVGLGAMAALYAARYPARHLAALLLWLCLAIATGNPFALAAAAAHGVAAYLCFVRVQHAMVREAFTLAHGTAVRGQPLLSWRSAPLLRGYHPARLLPR